MFTVSIYYINKVVTSCHRPLYSHNGHVESIH